MQISLGINKRHTFADRQGVSFTEILVGILIFAILVLGAVRMLKTSTQHSKTTLVTSNMEQALSRFINIATNDLNKAGSDPTNKALRAYIQDAICAGKIEMKYGINPDPADPTCLTSLGDLGILSYIAYDANGDGAVDPEEGLDLVSAVPTLRTTPEDYVVYQFTANTIVRKNLGEPSTTADDSQYTVLKNVIAFTVRYYGYDDSGIYGEITANSRFDDIREVEIYVMVHSGAAETGYNNPALASSSPYYHYRTAEKTFRTILIVRKD